MAQKWTPGPWTVDDGMVFQSEDPGWKICNCSGFQEQHQGKLEITANARFISAAPDMEEALKAYEEWEADVIVGADWSDETPKLTQKQWDRFLEIQGMRNAALSKAGKGIVQ